MKIKCKNSNSETIVSQSSPDTICISHQGKDIILCFDCVDNLIQSLDLFVNTKKTNRVINSLITIRNKITDIVLSNALTFAIDVLREKRNLLTYEEEEE